MPAARRPGRGSAGWKEIKEGSRQILSRLLHRTPERRYLQASQLEADLAWLLQMIDLAGEPNAAKRLSDQAWRALSQERYEHVLAAADLAFQQNPDDATRQMLETWHEQAKANWRRNLRPLPTPAPACWPVSLARPCSALDRRC